MIYIFMMSELKWPPTEKQIKHIASDGLKMSEKKDVKVLVYWENDPNLMIFDPAFFAKTEYINQTFNYKDRSIEVIIGKVD